MCRSLSSLHYPLFSNCLLQANPFEKHIVLAYPLSKSVAVARHRSLHYGLVATFAAFLYYLQIKYILHETCRERLS